MKTKWKVGDRVKFGPGSTCPYTFTIGEIGKSAIFLGDRIELKEIPGRFPPEVFISADPPAPEEDETPAEQGIKSGDFVAFVQFQSYRYEVEAVFQDTLGPQVTLKAIPGMFSADLFVRADPPEATT